jgi:hypothetical protein
MVGQGPVPSAYPTQLLGSCMALLRRCSYDCPPEPPRASLDPPTPPPVPIGSEPCASWPGPWMWRSWSLPPGPGGGNCALSFPSRSRHCLSLPRRRWRRAARWVHTAARSITEAIELINSSFSRRLSKVEGDSSDCSSLRECHVPLQCSQGRGRPTCLRDSANGPRCHHQLNSP